MIVKCVWLRGVASDEIEKISQVQIVKDLVNHTNEFELYAAAKEKTMEIFKQGSNMMALFLGWKLSQQIM